MTQMLALGRQTSRFQRRVRRQSVQRPRRRVRPFFETEKYLCGNLCPLIQGDTLVYVDQHHLSGPFAELFKGRLLEAIRVSIEESN